MNLFKLIAAIVAILVLVAGVLFRKRIKSYAQNAYSKVKQVKEVKNIRLRSPLYRKV